MKLLRTLFRYLIGWFVTLFSKQTKKSPFTSEPTTIVNNRIDMPDFVPLKDHFHNNRKRTRGRLIQVVDMGWTSHVIYKVA